MQDFLIQSLIASVVLTVILNLLPRVFPKATQRAERKIHETMKEAFKESEDGSRPKAKMFFPWKTMLLVSLVLTILLNFVAYIVQR